MENERPVFTEEMKKDYTILAPNMLPMHFKLLEKILGNYGYKIKVLKTLGDDIKETGLKYVHNDTCYPAILVIGQFINALQSGEYDTHKVALMLSQTGGGCRASNYIHLLKKALDKAGFGYVPVISFNISGLEECPGFKLTLHMLHRMLYAILYGDLLMLLENQCKPYEKVKGESEALADKWTRLLAEEMKNSNGVNYRHIKDNYRKILEDFAKIPLERTPKVKVGIVGEIYVKYSPLGNNNLAQFLVDEGAEVVIPGMFDFCMYCVKNTIMDTELYGRGKRMYPFAKIAYNLLLKKQKDLINIIEEQGVFNPMMAFDKTVTLSKGYISIGAKMGEGWLLTSEMIELAHSGADSIVCTQPFGCLPNHICGKGMIKPIRVNNRTTNIVPIDYDAGATKVNQENRLKLMLENARNAKGI